MSKTKTFVVKRVEHINDDENLFKNRFAVTGDGMVEQFSIELPECEGIGRPELIRVTIEPVKSKRERRRDALRAWFSGSARERFSREDDMLDMLDAIDSEDP